MHINLNFNFLCGKIADTFTFSVFSGSFKSGSRSNVKRPFFFAKNSKTSFASFGFPFANNHRGLSLRKENVKKTYPHPNNAQKNEYIRQLSRIKYPKNDIEQIPSAHQYCVPMPMMPFHEIPNGSVHNTNDATPIPPTPNPPMNTATKY